MQDKMTLRCFFLLTVEPLIRKGNSGFLMHTGVSRKERGNEACSHV